MTQIYYVFRNNLKQDTVRGMTFLIYCVKGPERSRGPGFAVCLKNSRQKGSFASAANFNPNLYGVF